MSPEQNHEEEIMELNVEELEKINGGTGEKEGSNKDPRLPVIPYMSNGGKKK